MYRIIAKSTKPKASRILFTQLILNDKLCQDLLPVLVSLIKHVTIDASSFQNAPLIIPLITESLFILNKIFEGFKQMNLTSRSNNDLVHNYKSLTHLGESLVETILEKSIGLFLLGDDCFKDKVTVSNKNSTNQVVIFGKSLIYLLTSMISLGKSDHSVFYEFFSTRSSDIYSIALNAFLIRKDDAELFDQSFQNYLIDLEDMTSKYVLSCD